MQWLAIAFGAGLGACLRAWLSRFNGQLVNVTGWSWLPLGTLIANVLGGLLMGMAIVVFDYFASQITTPLNPNIKMMISTGFLGGLTTFSTFSAEVFTLLNDGKVLFGLSLVLLHVFVTLCATAIGFYFMKVFL